MHEGVDVNIQVQGTHGQLDGVSMLLKHGGVDASVKSRVGTTAFDIAWQACNA